MYSYIWRLLITTHTSFYKFKNFPFVLHNCTGDALYAHFHEELFDFLHKSHTLWFKSVEMGRVTTVPPYAVREKSLNYIRKFQIQSSFIKFFIDNLIDVPLCFKKIPSLKRPSHDLYTLRFTNYIMKSGKKTQAHNQLFHAWNLFSIHNKNQHKFHGMNIFVLWTLFSSVSASFFKLQFTHHLIDQFVEYESTAKTPSPSSELAPLAHPTSQINTSRFTVIRGANFDTPVDNPHFATLLTLLSAQGKWVSSENYTKNQLLGLFSRISLIFNFSIFNVPKNIRKFSRNKSGKYIIIWKYIPFYKRLSAVMKLIAKNIKFIEELKFSQKITKSLLNLNSDLRENFLWRQKNFAYNHIFKNYRQSLMKTLRVIR